MLFSQQQRWRLFVREQGLDLSHPSILEPRETYHFFPELIKSIITFFFFETVILFSLSWHVYSQ